MRGKSRNMFTKKTKYKLVVFYLGLMYFTIEVTFQFLNFVQISKNLSNLVLCVNVKNETILHPTLLF